MVREVTGAERLMVVGHEPTMSGVVEYLTGHRIRVTTATLAYRRSGYASWSDLAYGTARLELLIRPRLRLAGRPTDGERVSRVEAPRPS